MKDERSALVMHFALVFLAANLEDEVVEQLNDSVGESHTQEEWDKIIEELNAPIDTR